MDLKEELKKKRGGGARWSGGLLWVQLGLCPWAGPILHADPSMALFSMLGGSSQPPSCSYHPDLGGGNAAAAPAGQPSEPKQHSTGLFMLMSILRNPLGGYAAWFQVLLDQFS